jgi:Stc1 domain
MRACTKCGEVKPLDAFPPVRRGEPKLQTWCRDCFAEANARNYRKNHEREKARLVRQVAERRAEVHERIIGFLREHPCVDCGETDIVVLEFDHVAEKLDDISVYAGGGRSWARVKAEIDKCEVRCANCHRRKTVERGAFERPSKSQGLSHSRLSGRAIQLRLDASLGLRECRVCGKTKPMNEFPYRSLERQTRQWICLSCQREYTNEWYSRNAKRQIANARLGNRRATAELKVRIREYLIEHPCVDCGESDPTVLDFDHLRDKRANMSTLVRYGLSWKAIEAEIAKCEVRCANCHRRRTATIGGFYRVRATEIARIEGLTP